MSIFQLYRGEYKLNSIKDLESLKTRPVLELTIYRIQGEYHNNYTDTVRVEGGV